MEFDINRVYTPANAGELKAGSCVVLADTMAGLKRRVKDNEVTTLREVESERQECRFTNPSRASFFLAYLVATPEEKILEWTDLKVGDVIRTKDGSETASVISICKGSTDEHIIIGNWLRDDDLEKHWEKKED